MAAQQQQKGGRAAERQRQCGRSRAVFKNAAQWQRRQSGSGRIRKHETSGSGGGGGGNSTAAEMAAAAAAWQQKAARLAGRQDSGGGRAEVAMAALQVRIGRN
jgi:hypothetical protein